MTRDDVIKYMVFLDQGLVGIDQILAQFPELTRRQARDIYSFWIDQRAAGTARGHAPGTNRQDSIARVDHANNGEGQ